MRCPKCNTNNYGDVSICYRCGEPLNVASQTAQHRYGPCPFCGNPQAEYFAAGRGQCRACYKTFTWREDLIHKEQPEEEKKPGMLLVVVALIAVVIVVAASLGAWYMLSQSGDDDDGGGAPSSTYINFRNFQVIPEGPQAGSNVTVLLHMDFKRPSDYHYNNTHVELFISYRVAGTSALAEDNMALRPDAYANYRAALKQYDKDAEDVSFENWTAELPPPTQNVVYERTTAFGDAEGDVTFQVKVYSSSEWNSNRDLDKKSTLAESLKYDDKLSY